MGIGGCINTTKNKEVRMPKYHKMPYINETHNVLKMFILIEVFESVASGG